MKRSWALGSAMDCLREIVSSDETFEKEVRDFSLNTGNLFHGSSVSSALVEDERAYIAATFEYRVFVKRKKARPLHSYFGDLEDALRDYADPKRVGEPETFVHPVARRIAKNAYVIAAALEGNEQLHEAFEYAKTIGDGRGPEGLNLFSDLMNRVWFDETLLSQVPQAQTNYRSALVLGDLCFNYPVIKQVVQDTGHDTVSVKRPLYLIVQLPKAA